MQSASGTVPATNAATSFWHDASPLTAMLFDPNFKPSNPHAGDHTHGIGLIDVSKVPNRFDLVEAHRTLRRETTRAKTKHMLHTGRNAPTYDLVSRNCDWLLYSLRETATYDHLFNVINITVCVW
jgi:poly(3-hydroxybutyrate) depolymerase